MIPFRFPGDVIRFRAHACACNDAYDLGPTTAEEMPFAALRGVPMTKEFDDSAKSHAQVVILADLVGELDEHRLDDFLTKARAQADGWLTEHERP